ncbi:MAG: 6-phosphofructokinase [Lachnospiraceae bacterium]|nr:6-phosphofructokinase [Lachnospiraceae bacterium]
MKRNVMVGQSGGPTAAINASLAGIYITAKECGAKTVYGMLNGIQGLLEGRYIDLSEHVKDDLDAELLKRTPASFLGSCRYKLPAAEGNEDVYEKVFAMLKKLDIEVFIYIGGNDSMDTINKLSKYGQSTGSEIRFIGCPKTVDNDLALTDHTPGYGSAAKYIAVSMKELIRDSFTIDFKQGMCTIVEIMGRDAGWLTGAAALSKDEDCDGPDLIYLPEVPFDIESFREKVKDLLAKKVSVVVAVSEGIRTADGTYVCELGSGVDFVDVFGHKQLSGTASYLAGYIAGEFGCKTRAIEFSMLQRAGSHIASLTDTNEGYAAGRAAILAADEGKTGLMVVFERLSKHPYVCGTALRDVDKIANDERVVPREWINEDGDYVTEEFLSYARPLIRGELVPIMVNSLPKHLAVPDGLRERR